MNIDTTQLGCPQCPDGREPRAAFQMATSWAGCCQRHKTFWRLAEEPSGVPKIGSVRGFRDLDEQAAREHALNAAGFRRIPVMAPGTLFWVHPDRPGTFTTDEAFDEVANNG